MTITELVVEAHSNALEKGWYEDPKTFGELIALVHSELSEALEDYRNGLKPDVTLKDDGGKPYGIPSELADVIIRVADMCGYYNIDLEAAVKAKLAFNRTRPYRHGGKVL